jgi:FixJ family two-component response regulator
MIQKRPLIAVVDDDESVRDALTRLLHTSEFEVNAFASGEEFLESLAIRRPDCVILDFHLPGLNGRDVQRRLTLNKIVLPVIVVTAHDHPASRQQCLEDGAIAWLLKPLCRDDLLASIDKAIS